MVDQERALRSRSTTEGARLRQGLLDKTNTARAVWADTAYRSKANEDFLAKNGFVSRIHRKKPPGRSMPETTRRANALKSKVRSRVEHVFAVQKDKMDLFIRTIGIARATMKIGMVNLVKQRPAAKLTIDLKFRAVFSPSATRLKRLSRPTPCSMRARQKYEAGDFDEDAEAADFLQQYEARIAALERLVDKQALELEFIKGAVKSTPRPKNATTSVVVGPRASASQKDAG